LYVFNILNIYTNETLFLNDKCEFLYLIHKNYIMIMQGYNYNVNHTYLHQYIISRKDTSFIYKLYTHTHTHTHTHISCQIYTLKPMDFAWTYCFMLFTQIILKFRDIASLWCKRYMPMAHRKWNLNQPLLIGSMVWQCCQIFWWIFNYNYICPIKFIIN
jgi:hypothetical protein